jgi:hypothetical protein
MAVFSGLKGGLGRLKMGREPGVVFTGWLICKHYNPFILCYLLGRSAGKSSKNTRIFILCAAVKVEDDGEGRWIGPG